MNSTMFDGSNPDPEEPIEPILRILSALGVAEICYTLSGGGDSGDTDIAHIIMKDGSTRNALPNITIGFSPAGTKISLAGFLDAHASEAPDGDWCNNEGGSGTVTYRPDAEDEYERVEVDMTYGEEDAYDDDFDEDFEDVNFDDDLDRDPDLISNDNHDQLRIVIDTEITEQKAA